MFFKGKLKYIFSVLIVFIIIYIFIGSFPLGEDVYLTPEWALDISDNDNLCIDTETGFENPDLKLKPFILKDSFGYFTEEGRILKKERNGKNVSISSDWMAVYGEKNLSTQVYSPDGKQSFKIDEAGFVHIDKNRIYLFVHGGNSVCEYDSKGNRLWKYSHTAPITAFNSTSAGTVIGYSDGMLRYIDKDGKKIFDIYPGGSNFEVILGASVSEDGKTVACICGIEKQRVLLINVNVSQHKIIYHNYLKNNLRKQAFIDFDSGGRFIVFEYADGIGILDSKTYTCSFIDEQGSIIGIGIDKSQSILNILIQNEKKCSILFVDTPGFFIGKTSFDAENTFLIQEDDKIYIGADNKILYCKIRGLR